MKIWILSLVILFSLPGGGAELNISPFGGLPPDHQKILMGITTLFKDTSSCLHKKICPSPQKAETLTVRAIDLHQHLRNLVSMHPVTTFEDRASYWGPLHAFEVHDFKFPSLIQRNGADPSNWVIGRYIAPRRFEECPFRFPTLVIVHSSVDNFRNDEGRLAEKLVTVSQRMGVMWIYLPHYGPRRLHDHPINPRDLNEDFLDPDPHKMRENFAQAVMDLHVALNWLKNQRSVDSSRISMMGFSMGGILQNIFEGMDPGMITGGHVIFTGGGDTAEIMAHYFQNNPTEDFTKKFLNAGWDENHTRDILADIDPITWAHRIAGLRILAIAAKRDQIIDRKLSFDKFLKAMDPSVSVNVDWMDTEHAPRNAPLFLQLTKIFWPTLSFAVGDGPEPPPYACRLGSL